MRFLPLVFLAACATFSQQPKPVGEPGPMACVGAQSAAESWRLLDIYMRQVLEAQTRYSCAPVAPPPAEAPVVPALR
jgi:hypothetical protein